MSGVLDLFRLDGKVAVVTGASSGLGAGFAVALAEAGANVVLGSRRADRLDEVAAAVTATGRQSLPVPVDITDPSQCTTLVDTAVDRFGAVDVLINNAGASTDATPAIEQDHDEFRRVVDVNLNGTFWMAQACGRVMRPGSSVVNVSSILGLAHSPAPQTAYSASKAALLGLTRSLSQQWSGKHGIRVNAVAPGYFATDMIAEIPEHVLAEIVGQSPLGRLGHQHELDALVVFLASPASTYITGSTLVIDGGMSGH